MKSSRKPPLHVSLNGKLIPQKRAMIPITDSGYLLGLGVFETVKIDEGVPLFFEDHMQRLAAGLKMIKIEKPVWDIAAETARVVKKNRLATALVRITVSGGSPGGNPTLAVMPRPILPLQPPVRIGVSPYTKDSHGIFAGVKTTSRLLYELTRRWAEANGCFDAMTMNHEGDLAEGAVSNLFCVIGAKIFTPPLSRGLLAGVTRAHLLSICKRRRIQVTETPLTVGDMEMADEVILTNTSRGILPVDRVRSLRARFPGAAGPVVSELQMLYNRRVEKYKAAHSG